MSRNTPRTASEALYAHYAEKSGTESCYVCNRLEGVSGLFCESCDERISLKLECLAEKRPLAIVIHEIRRELRAARH